MLSCPWLPLGLDRQPYSASCSEPEAGLGEGGRVWREMQENLRHEQEKGVPCSYEERNKNLISNLNTCLEREGNEQSNVETNRGREFPFQLDGQGELLSFC